MRGGCSVTNGNPADLHEDNSAREIEVSWVNEENALLHVRIVVTPQQYLKAVEAHKAGYTVSATGLLTRVGRPWRLERVTKFRVIRF